jgi:glycosyltransferase involved in cell wall biosynthesis
MLKQKSNKKRLLVDMYKLADGYSGLWEVAHQYGLALTRNIDFSKWEVTFLVPKHHPFTDTRVRYKRILWAHRFLLWLCRFDVAHALSQCSPYLRYKSRRTKYVCTIHDLNFLYEKTGAKIERYRRKYQRSIAGLSRAVFISRYALNDARQHLRLGALPCSVIYNGVAQRSGEQPAEPQGMQELLQGRKYLLLVSTFMVKKNIHLLVDMMRYLPDLCLVVAGQIVHRDYYAQVQESVRAWQLEGRVFILGQVGEAQKYWLLQNCCAFVFPSAAEGFGIPPIEAMRAGKAVFVSRLTSIPEVCGEMAFYWDTLEGKAMADAVRRCLSDTAAKQNNPDLLRQYSARYDWDNCAREYIKIMAYPD